MGPRLDWQKELYNKKVHNKLFERDFVLLLNVVPRGCPRELHQPWTRPFKIVNHLSDVAIASRMSTPSSGHSFKLCPPNMSFRDHERASSQPPNHYLPPDTIGSNFQRIAESGQHHIKNNSEMLFVTILAVSAHTLPTELTFGDWGTPTLTDMSAKTCLHNRQTISEPICGLPMVCLCQHFIGATIKDVVWIVVNGNISINFAQHRYSKDQIRSQHLPKTTPPFPSMET